MGTKDISEGETFKLRPEGRIGVFKGDSGGRRALRSEKNKCKILESKRCVAQAQTQELVSVAELGGSWRRFRGGQGAESQLACGQ